VSMPDCQRAAQWKRRAMPEDAMLSPSPSPSHRSAAEFEVGRTPKAIVQASTARRANRVQIVSPLAPKNWLSQDSLCIRQSGTW
jgi:hypothetical protein